MLLSYSLSATDDLEVELQQIFQVLGTISKECCPTTKYATSWHRHSLLSLTLTTWFCLYSVFPASRGSVYMFKVYLPHFGFSHDALEPILDPTPSVLYITFCLRKKGGVLVDNSLHLVPCCRSLRHQTTTVRHSRPPFAVPQNVLNPAAPSRPMLLS